MRNERRDARFGRRGIEQPWNPSIHADPITLAPRSITIDRPTAAPDRSGHS